MIRATIELPRTPMSWNTLFNRSKKSSWAYREEKLMWRTYLLAAKNSGGWWRQADEDPIPKVVISIIVYSKRWRDPDRLVVQPLIDCLHTRLSLGPSEKRLSKYIKPDYQGLGMLVDDSNKYVEEVRLRTVKVTGGNVFTGTVIRIRDASDYDDIDSDIDKTFFNAPAA